MSAAKNKLITGEFREYVLAELRTARLRAKMYVNEIEAIGIALKGHLIEPELALEWMHYAGTLDFIVPTKPEDENVNVGPDELDGRLEAQNVAEASS